MAYDMEAIGSKFSRRQSLLFLACITMKITTSTALACFPLSAILIWTAAAQTDPDQSNPTPEEAAQSEAVARMEQREAEILERVGLPSHLALPAPGEEDIAAVALERGLIVEATLEEVEAALNAAKATPELDDDFEAMKLAHRGSYRFFLDDKPSEEASH